MRLREPFHVCRADRDARRQSERGGNSAALAPPDLQTVADIRNRRELAAVAGEDRRHAQPAGRGRGHEAGRKRPIAVDDVERAVMLQRSRQRGVLAQHASRTSQVAHHRAAQRIAARLFVVAERVHEHIVLPCQPFDQPDDGGNHLFAAASIDAAGHDEGDSHARPLFHTRP